MIDENDIVKRMMEILENNLLKIMCECENAYFRKLAILNIDINRNNDNNDLNLKLMLERTRDKEPEIRKLVYDRVKVNKIYIEHLKLPALSFQFLMDGVNSRDERVRSSCLSYYKSNFNDF